MSLMIRFGLLVPMLVPIPYEKETDECQYLVPALMGEGPVLDVDDAPLRLYFWMKDQCQGAERNNTVLYHEEDLRDGFLPLGAFHALCVGVVGCSAHRPGQHVLHRNSACVLFDGVPVTLSFIPEFSRSCVMVHLGGSSENGWEARVVDRLRVILVQELSIYSNLQCQALVRCPGSARTWVVIDALPLAATQMLSHPLRFRGELLSAETLQPLLKWFTASCTFSFILADKLRESTRKTFPKLLPLQDMIRRFPDWVVERTVFLDKACRGEYKQEFLAVSHRWEDQGDCDPTEVQLATLKEFLNTSRNIKYVFIDYMCMYQGRDRTPAQKALFGVQLSNINILFLGASVLILLDYEYLSRFWTQFEAWLSMQIATETGLVSAPERKRRCSIVCIHGAAEAYKRALVEQWSNCNAMKAHEMLSAPSVKVTNMSDKLVQLPKIVLLDWIVRRCVLASSNGAKCCMWRVWRSS